MRDFGLKPLVAVTAVLFVAACSDGGGQPAPQQTAEKPAAAPAEALVEFASLTGDAAKGERLFVRCRSCHAVEAGVNRVGPSLHGVMGRPSAAVPKFRYSPAMKASNITWTQEAVFAYLEHPPRSMPGTYMSFAGLRDPQDRADMIAYLKTLT